MPQQVLEINVSPSVDVVHVGDHYEFDYLVPRSLGIHALYLDRSGEKKGDFVIQDLRNLEEKIPGE